MKNINTMGALMPVEKCMGGHDVRVLSDAELLAVVLGTGCRSCTVLKLSESIMERFNGLYGIHKSGIRELADLRGIGNHKAVRIHSAFEMGRRVITNASAVRQVSSPEAVWRLLLPDLAGLQNERFFVLVLNNKNCLMKKSLISIGTASEALVHPREVFRDAIREGGAGIIISHNHPSGILSPSREDVAATRRLQEAGRIIGIPLLDHVIICNTSYFSMKENNAM